VARMIRLDAPRRTPRGRAVSVRISAAGADARSAAGRASASTSASGADARSAAERASAHISLTPEEPMQGVWLGGACVDAQRAKPASAQLHRQRITLSDVSTNSSRRDDNARTTARFRRHDLSGTQNPDPELSTGLFLGKSGQKSPVDSPGSGIRESDSGFRKGHVSGNALYNMVRY